MSSSVSIDLPTNQLYLIYLYLLGKNFISQNSLCLGVDTRHGKGIQTTKRKELPGLKSFSEVPSRIVSYSSLCTGELSMKKIGIRTGLHIGLRTVSS